MEVDEGEDKVDYVLAQGHALDPVARRKAAQVLDEDKLERMIDALEKATGTGAMVTQDAAEKVLTAKMGLQPTSATRRSWLTCTSTGWGAAREMGNPCCAVRSRRRTTRTRTACPAAREGALQAAEAPPQRHGFVPEDAAASARLRAGADVAGAGGAPRRSSNWPMLSTEHFEQAVHDLKHPTPGPPRESPATTRRPWRCSRGHRAFVGLAESNGGATGRPLKRAKRSTKDNDDFEYPDGVGGRAQRCAVGRRGA